MTLRRLLVALLLIVGVMGVAASAEAQEGCHGRGLLLTCGAQPGPTLDLSFLSGTLDSRVSFSRASGATSALYTDAAGASFTTYSNNQPRLMSQGLLIEEQRTNFLLNSGAPATQTTGSLSTGSYVFFCNGTGSVTSSAGTATATGLGAQSCSAGTYQSISVSVAGTLTFTVSGSVNWFDLQGGTFPTSHIVTAGAVATRSADVATVATSAFAYNQNAGTFEAEAIPAIVATGSSFGGTRWNILSATGGSVTFNMDFTPFFDTALRLESPASNGANFTTATTNSPIANATFKAAMTWNASGYGLVLNAGAVKTGTFSLAGNGDTSITLSGHPQLWYGRARYWRRSFSGVGLQQLTQ